MGRLGAAGKRVAAAAESPPVLPRHGCRRAGWEAISCYPCKCTNPQIKLQTYAMLVCIEPHVASIRCLLAQEDTSEFLNGLLTALEHIMIYQAGGPSKFDARSKVCYPPPCCTTSLGHASRCEVFMGQSHSSSSSQRQAFDRCTNDERQSKKCGIVQETTLLHHIFGGYQRMQNVCTVCHNVSASFEPFVMLSVEMDAECSTIEETLARYEQPITFFIMPSTERETHTHGMNRLLFAQCMSINT